MRTKKTVDGWDYEYYYSDGLLVRQTYSVHGATDYIDFLYDESGTPYSFIYNGTQYYYIKNLQNDVIAIANTSGSIVVNYTYDAWGNVLSITDTSNNSIGTINPIRYRSYYYDTDTGFYYLQSRYYDPAIRRFINADGYVSTGTGLLGYNMYAYCGNNPVMYVDYTGEAWYHWAIGAAVVIGFAALTIATCGGSLAAAGTAVGMVASGSAAFSTASTVAAAGFIGSASVYGTAVLYASSNSKSVDEFCERGNWGTVISTTIGATIGSAYGYGLACSQLNNQETLYNLDGSKNENYVNKRGWNDDMINNAMKNGRQGSSVNMANGRACTAYLYPGTNNQYVVIENESHNLVQVSNFNDTNWIPDNRIVWD